MTVTLAILATVCLATTVLGSVPVSHGLFRVFEFPRVQTFAVAAAAFVAALWLLPLSMPHGLVHAALASTLLIQAGFIAPFLPFWKRRAADHGGQPADAPTLRIMVSNVKQSNRRYRRLIDLIGEASPDMVVLTETDSAWADALGPVRERYPHRIECPMQNSYGMMLFSRYELPRGRIRHLVDGEVPSFDAIVKVAHDRKFRLLTLHPEPPLIHRRSAMRDAEILKAGEIVRDEHLPVIVTGDLNDVAWSRLSRSFLRISRLVDPREGRGFFSTFHARFLFLRWPLDHMFHSRHFEVVAIRRLPPIGSDHFPILFELAFTRVADSGEAMPPAMRGERRKARQVIAEGRDMERRPVGHDWEQDSS